jgi:hypothetical protein
MLLTDLREQLARYLADFDSADPDESFRTWSEEDIDHAIRLACLTAFAARPGRFAQRVELDAPDGFLNTQTDACTDVLQVVGIKWPDGSTTPNAQRVKQKRENIPTTSRQTCAPGEGSEATKTTGTTVRVLPGVDNMLAVDPPLPAGAKIIAVCAVAPPMDYGVLDMPPQFYPVVFEWALAHLMGTEIESATAGGHSDRHWRRGAEMLGLSAAEARALRQRSEAPQ